MSKESFFSNIICSDCSNIKMFGINYEYQNKKLENITQIYTLCSSNHSKNDNIIEKIPLDNLFSKGNENKIDCDFNSKCEFCKNMTFQYHCIECKRNICKKCLEYHKTHSYYYEKDYISEEELENLKNNLNKTKNIAKTNFDNIEKSIKNFESQ